MTSLEEHTGRPEVAPWLRGWIDEKPQTAVVWRRHIPVRADGDRPSVQELKRFFEAAPPHTSELLETETFRVRGWLIERAGQLLAEKPVDTREEATPIEGTTIDRAPPIRGDDVAVVVLDSSGTPAEALSLRVLAGTGLAARDRKNHEDRIERRLQNTTAIVDARLGGLGEHGLLDAQVAHPPRTADDGETWIARDAVAGVRRDVIPFRIRFLDAGQEVVRDPNWRERQRIPAALTESDDVTRWLVVEKWRHDAATEDDRSAGRPQLLEEHQQWAQERARGLADRLRLPAPYAEALALAAGLHDEGKRASRWQRAFHARSDGVYAKTLGPVSYSLLDGYRHELGSLLRATKDPRLHELPGDLQDLVLHLIIAHHGFARPVIGTRGCDDAPPPAIEERAREIALRFARLQRRWGPWGLAWWEAVLRAADQQASRDNDAADVSSPTEDQ
jgi:CRISPR-associated endonuclease/helicase Cas3